MTIKRYGSVAAPAPIASQMVVHGGKIYIGGIRAAHAGPDIQAQTTHALKHIEHLLEQAGSKKVNILTVQIWLSNMDYFSDMNQAWNAWVTADSAPLRACVRAELSEPDALVEFLVTAIL